MAGTGDDFTDEDIVVSSRENMAELALGVSQRLGENGCPGETLKLRDVGELPGTARGEAGGERFLLPGQDVYGKRAGFLQELAHRGTVIDGDEQQGRIGGQGGDGTRGHPVKIVSVSSRDDCHSGRKSTEDILEDLIRVVHGGGFALDNVGSESEFRASCVFSWREARRIFRDSARDRDCIQ